MSGKAMETWELWYPKAAATGMLFARSRVDPVAVVLVHAAPRLLAVRVEDEQGQVVASHEELGCTDETPITRLTRTGDSLVREDIWPGQADIGTLVILPGGEAGYLKKWWHAADHSEWRWQVEFYNHR